MGSTPTTKNLIAENRQQAIKLNYRKYYGRKCSKHPSSPRYLLSGLCCECVNEKAKEKYTKNKGEILEELKQWGANNPIKSMLRRCKRRASSLGVEFSLVEEDILIPEYCPILNIKLIKSADIDSAPSIDRVDNTRGYTKDNIIIISHRANRLKSDASIDELNKLVEFYNELFK